MSRILRYFASGHLPPDLSAIAEPIEMLARQLDRELSGPEAEAGLRKLLEAKDCFVRARLDKRVVEITEAIERDTAQP